MQPKTKTVLFIILIFILGIASGWFLKERLHTGGPRGAMPQQEFVKILTEQVHLTELQLMQIDSILDIKQKKMEIIKKQSLALRDSTRNEVRRLLDVQQQKLFDDFIKEKDRRNAHEKEQQNK
jgi:hypothetical protein